MQYLEDSSQYFHRISNQMDTLIMILLVSHIVVDIVAKTTDNILAFDSSMYLLMIATIFAYLRLLNVFAFSQSLGPLFFVIMRLIKDVGKWVFIFVIFMISFQLAIMALTSEAGDDQWEGYPTGTFAVAFFTIIGDYSYAMGTMDKTYLGVVLLAIYGLISQIMLVNLLIAMMGNTYSDVKDNSDKEWRFYRYLIVYEYKTNSSYPPPFNFIIGPFVTINEWMRKHNGENTPKIALRSRSMSFQMSATEKEQIEQSVMKKMKIGKNKVAEKEEELDRVSLKNVSYATHEQLRMMSSQIDNDRKYFEQQFKALKEHDDNCFEEMLRALKALKQIQNNPIE